jgi:hypothetical protein
LPAGAAPALPAHREAAPRQTITAATDLTMVARFVARRITSSSRRCARDSDRYARRMETFVHFIGGSQITVEGDINRVADLLGRANKSAAGYCQITDVVNRRLMVNPDHVLYLEEFGSEGTGGGE